jgi:hypothetical protein
LVDFGVYSINIADMENLESAPGGKLKIVEETHHIETTNTFPAVIGTSFGVEYIVHSQKFDRIMLRINWIPSTPVTGKSGTKIKEISFERTIPTNSVLSLGYTLDRGSELEPESWTLQISYKDVLLLEKTFYASKN